MNKQEKTKLAASILGAHEELNEVYICDDGNAFRTEVEAKIHVKQRGITFECFEKADMPTFDAEDAEKEDAEKEDAEKEAAEKEAAEKESAGKEDQKKGSGSKKSKTTKK